MDLDLERLVVRHRHVAPMLSTVLGATHAAVRITDAKGGLILEREAGGIGTDRFPIVVDGDTVGWVEGDRVARAVAAVIAYAAAREADKRSLAREALDRYRELNLVYELAETLSGLRSVAAIGQASLAEVNRIRGEGKAFLLLADPESGWLSSPDGVPAGPIDGIGHGVGIVGGLGGGEPAIINDVAADPRSSPSERTMGALIVAPLRARGVAFGAIGAGTDGPHEYEAGDLKVLTAIASLTGPAIAQARASESDSRLAAR
jgi:GAF domain-containing protein